MQLYCISTTNLRPRCARVNGDHAPFRHLVSQSEIGLLLNGKNTGEGVEALLKLHAVDIADHTLRRNQVQQFAQRYNWRKIADRYADIYGAIDCLVEDCKIVSSDPQATLFDSTS